MEKMSFDFENNEQQIKSWKILIADDELEMHTITKLVLNNVTFLGKPLEFISTYSGKQTCEVVKENPDIALILLDVVMENSTSGLEVVKYIREELGNSLVRIIFRTGMPGNAPEREVINDYDINDYKEKTELTAPKLYTTIIAGLRNYRDLLITRQSERNTEKLMLYFRHIIDSMLSGVMVVNSDYNIEIYTRQVLDFISSPITNDISGMNVFEVLPFFSDYKKEIDEVLANQYRLEKMMIAAGKKIVNLIFCPLKEIGKRVVIRVDDVTALIEKERQLMYLQKLEMVGTLAAGVVHDFNNILGGISGAASLLELQAQKRNDLVCMETSDFDENLSLISKAVSKATDLSKKLLSLSKDNISEMKSINLVDVLIAATKVFKASINRSVQIKTMINCENAKIKGDSISLEQMLLNLFINASHAMTIMRGDNKSLWVGTLTITLDYKKADVVSEFGIQTDGGYVLSVADTGVGMSDEIKQKIFNPFFSTKNKGNGTGLGLLMVQNIVNGHGGFLKVISQPGVGSEFKIYLPIDEEKSK
jgi:signal transduction histidine kinase